MADEPLLHGHPLAAVTHGCSIAERTVSVAREQQAVSACVGWRYPAHVHKDQAASLDMASMAARARNPERDSPCVLA